MSPAHYQRITALVESALEIPLQQRDGFLITACGEDKELHQEVCELIEARENSGEFLSVPALEFLAEDIAGRLTRRDLSGKHLGRYRVLRPIGTGGMGEVWLANDSQLGREVALKLLSPESAFELSLTQRFQREAQAASTLNHPNIVTIYEIGYEGDISFIAQEFVRGETLRQRLTNGPLELAEVVAISSQIAAALSASHEAGIVHRDIKPENVMLRPDGLVKVLDFGLARFVNANSGIQNPLGLLATTPGWVIGTVKYMSPEQARGVEVTTASDIFSLGVVIYEMVNGALPFTGETAADVLASLLEEEPPRFVHQSTEHYIELERIVRRCLRKEPGARYRTVAELRSELNGLARSIEADKAHASAPARGRRRFALMAAILAIVVLGVLAAAAYRFGGARRVVTNPGSMRVSRLLSLSGALDAAISADGKFVAYVQDDAGGQSLWVRQVAAANQIRVLQPEMGQHWGLTFSPDGNFLYYVHADEGATENLYRVPVLGGNPRKLLDGVNGPIAFSPDGKQFGFVRLDGRRGEVGLMVAGIDGTEERRVAVRRRPASYSQFGLTWSPDGRTIACFGNKGGADAQTFNLVGVRVSDGAESWATSRGWAEAHSPVWPADGEILLAGKESPEGVDQIWAVSPISNAVRRVTNDLDFYSRIGLTADGKTLAALQTKGVADIWVAPAGGATRAIRLTSSNFPELDSIAWTPDGRILFSATGGDFESIWIMNADGAKIQQITAGPGYGNELAVTPDGRYVLYQFQRNIWRINLDGTDRKQLTFGALDVHPSSTSDSRWLVYASFEGWTPVIGGKPSLWKIPIDGGTAVHLSPASASIPEVSPDGKWMSYLYFSGEDPRFSPSRIAIVPNTGGEPAKLLTLPADASGEIHWAAGAKALDYVRMTNDVGNIWRQRLEGGAPVKITNFTSDRVLAFAWSRDGTRLALIRGKPVSDIVLITGF